LLLAAILLPLLVGGCQIAAPGSPAGGPLRVVAAESMWGSLAAQLGGKHVEVVSLISSPDVDPHSYEPTAADARAVAMAQLLVTNGLGYDAWATKLAAADPATGRHTVEVGAVLGLRIGANPHRWYSPTDVHRIVDAITAAYIAADPGDRTSYESLRTNLLSTGFAGYDAVRAAIRANYRGVAVGASESIFAPLAEDLGLNLMTPPTFLRAISEGIDPTAADQLLINDQITQHRIKVYVENIQNRTPDIARQAELAQANGIPVVDVTETLVPVNTTFQSWQVRQLQQLAVALAKATGR
jgi:zinc/manganese transport system substrate-binding protein